jgi:antitoxin VapB
MTISTGTDNTASVATRVFMNGNSQAVRIPQEFRLDCKQVQISRNAAGELVLRPLPPAENRGDALLAVLAAFEPSFAEAIEEERLHQPMEQERESL